MKRATVRTLAMGSAIGMIACGLGMIGGCEKKAADSSTKAPETKPADKPADKPAETPAEKK
ncbi:MAG: hypothetical protein IT435_03010 [Phycisphaerales bacterium]|nr:hypothetical protein [Phycisphaerales bacterium]